jgi:hypothetical protein
MELKSRPPTDVGGKHIKLKQFSSQSKKDVANTSSRLRAEKMQPAQVNESPEAVLWL